MPENPRHRLLDALVAVMTIGSFVWGLGSGALLDGLRKVFPNVPPVLLWISLVVVSVAILLSVAVAWRHHAKEAEYKVCGHYLQLVWHVLYGLRQKLQLAADELGRERRYEQGAQDKLRPVIANVDILVTAIRTSSSLMKNDQAPEVCELLRSVAEHTQVELVDPFNEPVNSVQANAVERKVSKASWSVACVSLLTNQLIGVVVTDPRYPQEKRN